MTAHITLRNGAPVTDLKRNGQTMMSTSTGELNAHDNKDLLNQIGHLMQQVANGNVVIGNQMSAVASDEQNIAEVQQLISEAAVDPAKWAALGSRLSQQVAQYQERAGFMRSLLMHHTLNQGDTPRIPVKTLDATAVIANGMDNLGFQRITQKILNVPEFEIKTNVRVNRLDVEQVNADLLDSAYKQSLEGIVVTEDRLWKDAADKGVGRDNRICYLGSKLTPDSVARLQERVTRWNLPAAKALIANDFWVDIQGGSDWHTALDPVSKYDLLLTGKLATVHGMELLTDAFRDPNQKVLEAGEIYVLSEPEYHGVYTNRGGIISTPTDGANQGNTDKGWLLSEFLSLTIANTRSYAKGIRG